MSPAPRPPNRCSTLRRMCLPAGFLWASPVTLFGLLHGLLTLATGGRGTFYAGAFEFCGGWAAFFLRNLVPLRGASAVTFGHVILGVDQAALDAAREHEHVHIRQYMRWGLFFIPAYLGCWLYLLLRGADPYLDNPFEKEAFQRR
ncbi:hypothetical protein JCM19992_05760 [Thermostilla marina]